MRVRVVILVLLACWSWIALGPPSAFADKAKAKESAKIYSRAGEQATVVLKVKAGQVMRVDRKDGRWLKVRVSGRTGWIPRSKVELLEDDEVSRNTRRRPFVDGRGTKRGFGGEQAPKDRIGADAVDVDPGVDVEPTRVEPKGKPKPKAKIVVDVDDEPEDDPKPTKPTKPIKPTKPDKPTRKPAAEQPVIKEEPDDAIADERPKVRVTGAATIYSEASVESEQAGWTVKPDTMLFPTATKGKFTEVENDEGEIGFILSSKIATVGAGATASGEVRESGHGTAAPRRRWFDIAGRFGVTLIKQGLRSDGPMALPDNYDLSTSAATIALGGRYLHRGNRISLGGELSVDIAKALPGISAPMGHTTSITLYHLNVRALAGIELARSGMAVFGRLGLRYQSYQVANVEDLTKNTAKLPSEIVTAPTFGVALVVPRLTSKIGLQLGLDTMLVGASVKQTKNLEDGSTSSAMGAAASLGVTYHWRQTLDIQASYDLDYAKYDFGVPLATSMRGHSGTGAVGRTDLFHAVTFGLAKAL